MSLNVITDLCRLLSRGYYHLYNVYNIVGSSSLSIESFDSWVPEDSIGFTLFDQLSRQFYLMNNHSEIEDEQVQSFHYLKYLQLLQKVIYLMVIDDYLSSESGLSFVEWMKNRPEIISVLESLNKKETRIFPATSVTQSSAAMEIISSSTHKSQSQSLAKGEEFNSSSQQLSFSYQHIQGQVLNFSGIIKGDYFPGSRNIHLVSITLFD